MKNYLYDFTVLDRSTDEEVRMSDDNCIFEDTKPSKAIFDWVERLRRLDKSFVLVKGDLNLGRLPSSYKKRRQPSIVYCLYSNNFYGTSRMRPAA